MIQLGLSPPEKRSNPAPAQPASPGFDLQWFYDRIDTSDVTVNATTVRQIASVAAALRLISQSVRSLPLHITEVSTGRKVTKHPAFRLINRAPNDEVTIDSLLTNVAESVLLHGAAYLQVTRNLTTKQVDGIWFLNPATVTPKRVGTNQTLVYSVTEGGRKQVLRPWQDIIPIIGAARLDDGVTPVSVLSQSREVFAKAMAIQQFATRFFSNFATPQMVLKTTKLVKPEMKSQMRADFEKLHGGSNAHRVAVLDQDLDVKVLSSSLKDNDVSALSAFAERQAASLFGADLAMLGSSTESATNASLIQVNLQFLRYSLGPLLVAIENGLSRGLVDDNHSVNFDTFRLMRMEPQAQAETAKNSNCLTVAEARAIGYNLPPLGTAEDSIVLSAVNLTNLPNLTKTIPSQMKGATTNDNQQA